MSIAVAELERHFRRQGAYHTYGKGQIICAQSAPFVNVYMIDSGMVKIYDIDETGAERTITVFARGNTFPIIWLLQDLPGAHMYFYEAFTNVASYTMPALEARTFVAKHPDILVMLLDTVTKGYLNFIGR